MKTYIWLNAFNGYYGNRIAIAVADNTETAKRMVCHETREDFKKAGYVINPTIERLGKPNTTITAKAGPRAFVIDREA